MAGSAGERRHHERRQTGKPVARERRGDTDRRGRRLANGASDRFEVRRRRLRVQVVEARRAIEASRDSLKKRKS